MNPRRLLRLSAVVLALAVVTVASLRADDRSAPPVDFAARFEQIKRAATRAELYTFLYDLPKGGDLHNHFGGSIWPSMWYAAATDPTRNGGDEFFVRTRIANCPDCTEPLLLWRTLSRFNYQRLPACCRDEYEPLTKLDAKKKTEWLAAMMIEPSGPGAREKFFEQTWPRLNDLFNNPFLLAELLVENMKRFGAEGVRYLETQAGFSQMVRADGSAVSPEAALDIIRERLARPDAKATGVTVRFQKTILRFLPDAERSLEEAFALVAANRDIYVGINLAGREDNQRGHPLRFLETFRRLRRLYSGIGLSIHAGEADAPNKHVRDTLLLGATRIGHGINLISDPDTMLLMRQNRFLVEINLVSNRLLDYVPDLRTHPFPEYLRTGIPVCLNTDDRGMWDSSMTDEYFTAVTTFDLTWPEIVQLGRHSLEYAFVEVPVKQRLLREYAEAVAAFEKKYSAADWHPALKAARVIGSGYARRTFQLDFPTDPPKNP